ncbi:hypothetical protein OOK41_29960 [Micromonospora sp. NBC_01655]|nr:MULTISPECIES: hypothetical protein [unclassified Micromonospora]MCX4474486.1 hypothetical protein [Micromonospora sp. NBC_01655]
MSIRELTTERERVRAWLAGADNGDPAGAVGPLSRTSGCAVAGAESA